MAAGIGLDERSVRPEALAAHKALGNAPRQHLLEQIRNKLL
jgi:hypothetical protein